MSEGLYTIIGVIIGMGGTLWIHRNDRRSRFRLANADEKFRVAQEAYKLADYLSHSLFVQEVIKMKRVDEAREWFTDHNLYLRPDVRDALDSTIGEVSEYKERLEYLSQLKQEGKSEEANEIRQEISRHFREIKGLPRKIQRSMDVYYNREAGIISNIYSKLGQICLAARFKLRTRKRPPRAT